MPCADREGFFPREVSARNVCATGIRAPLQLNHASAAIWREQHDDGPEKRETRCQ